MEFSEIRYARTAPMASVTLDRPAKLNAITPRMMSEVRAALGAAEADDEVRVVVIKGEGRAFSAGFDLSPRATPEDATEWRARFDDTNSTLRLVWRLGKPVVAQVHGACLGAAFDLAMACDLTVCADDAFFGEPEVRYGGTCQFLLLPWLVGMKTAKHILLTGDRISSAQALAWQLVNRVVPGAELDSAVAALCRTIAAAPRGTPGMNKRALNRAYEFIGATEIMAASEDLAVIAAMGLSDESRELQALIAQRGPKAALQWLESRFRG